jgi:hypothetical protein
VVNPSTRTYNLRHLQHICMIELLIKFLNKVALDDEFHSLGTPNDNFQPYLADKLLRGNCPKFYLNSSRS